LYHSILEIVPQFKLISQIDATLEVSDIEASVDMKYDLSGLSFDFPPQANSQAGSFTPGTTQNRESSALPVLRSSSNVPHRHRNVQSMNQPTNTERPTTH